MNNLVNISDYINTFQHATLPIILRYLNRVQFHVGELKWSSRLNDFNGWMKCDGRSVSRTDYPELFNTIGTAFGADDSETFKLPDMRGRVMGCVGLGNGLTARSQGDIVGTETHQLSTNELPSHSHTGTTAAAGSHSHTINDPGHTHTQTTINDDFNNSGTNPPSFSGDSAGTRTWTNINSAATGITVNSAADHTHTFTTAAFGGGQAHNNMQPTGFIGQVFIYTGKN